jgi:peptide/nickel transport system permease protein
MIHLIPGNIVQVMLGTGANLTHQQLRQLYALYGINRPLWQQYITWITSLLQGNFGVSLRSGLPIGSLLVQALGVTIELSLGALVIAGGIGVPLGMIAALYKSRFIDYALRILSLIGLAIPNFLLGMLLVLVTSVYCPTLSTFSYVPLTQQPVANLESMIVPMIALAVSLMAIIVRMTRAAVLNQMQEDFIRTARAKGITELMVWIKHVLRTSAIPIVTLLGLQAGYLLGGALVIENVFTLPGVGRLIVDAINQRDYPVVQMAILVVAIMVVLVNLCVDMSYAFLDPRIRYE